MSLTRVVPLLLLTPSAMQEQNIERFDPKGCQKLINTTHGIVPPPTLRPTSPIKVLLRFVFLKGIHIDKRHAILHLGAAMLLGEAILLNSQCLLDVTRSYVHRNGISPTVSLPLFALCKWWYCEDDIGGILLGIGIL